MSIARAEKKSPTKIKQSPPEKQQPERRARSNTLDSHHNQHLQQQPYVISTPASPYQPQVQTAAGPAHPYYAQQPPVLAYPGQYQQQQPLLFVSAGQHYPGAHLQPVPQPVVFQQQQHLQLPTQYGAAPSEWTSHGGPSPAPPQVHRARSQSTGTHEQRDLITW
jgi:hypothetical protein